MEVIVLGTGAADGWPSPFCECLSCADMRQHRRVRTPTAALIDGAILIDAGPAVPSAVARAGRSLRDVHHVLVTHAHPDHLDPALLLWLDWHLSVKKWFTGPVRQVDVDATGAKLGGQS